MNPYYAETKGVSEDDQDEAEAQMVLRRLEEERAQQNKTNSSPEKGADLSVPKTGEKPASSENKDIPDPQPEPQKRIEKGAKPAKEKAVEKAQEAELTDDEKLIKKFDNATEKLQTGLKQNEVLIKEKQDLKAAQEQLRLPTSIVEGTNRELIEARLQRQVIEDELKAREPSQKEQTIQLEIDGINYSLGNIELAKRGDLPGMVGSKIKADRERDIKDLESQRAEKLKKLQDEKVQKIKQFYKDEKGPTENDLGIEEGRKPEKKPEKQPEAEPAKDAKKPEVVEQVELTPATVLETEINRLTKEISETSGVEGKEEEFKLKREERLELLKARRSLAEELTGRNFSKEIKNEIVAAGFHIDSEGHKWIAQRRSKEVSIADKCEKIKANGISRVFKKEWDKPGDQKQTYKTPENFAAKLDEKRQDIEKKSGVSMSKEVFYALMSNGYKMQEAKKSSFLGIRKRVTIPKEGADGKIEYMQFTMDELRATSERYQKTIQENVTKVAEERWQQGQKVLKRAINIGANKRVEEISAQPKYKETVDKYWQERVEDKKEAEAEKQEMAAEKEEYEEFVAKLNRQKEKVQKKYKIKDLANLTEEEQKREEAVEFSAGYKESLADVTSKYELKKRTREKAKRSKILQMFKTIIKGYKAA